MKAGNEMLKGLAVSGGIGIGTVQIIEEKNIEVKKLKTSDPAREIERFDGAVDRFCENMQKNAVHIKKNADDSRAKIIEGHILMIRDPYMQSETRKKIKKGCSAEKAISDVCDVFENAFLSSGDERTMERAADVRDVKNGILSQLLGNAVSDFSKFPDGTVLVAEELTPTDASMIGDNITAVVTAEGGATSHFAILARAMGLPAVLSVKDITKKLKNGERVIVDGLDGVVIPSPSAEEEKKYQSKARRVQEEKKQNELFKNRPTLTADGVKKQVLCNIGSSAEAYLAADSGGEGVGLFRTEFLFTEAESIPTEEEQFKNYKKAVLAFEDREVIIRTLDVGGDKKFRCLDDIVPEENPFLGLRGIRYALKHEEILRSQLRAILRASAFGKIGIMIPLVTELEEVRQFKEIYFSEKQRLSEKGETIGKIKLGVMIETPAAVLIAPSLAKEVEFFSIGTNDLTQYIMTVDRGNKSVDYLFSCFAPAVVRSLKYVIESAKKAGIPVGMCGEAAADPLMIPLLVGLGLEEFSVSPISVSRTRREISKRSAKECERIAEKVFELSTEKEIKDYLKSLQ